MAMKQFLPLAAAFCLGAVSAFGLFLFAYLIVTDPGDHLTFVSYDVSTGPAGRLVVTGALRNNTDRFYARVAADVDLLDAAGRVVVDTFATTSDLGPYETWSFEVPVHAPEAVAAVVQGQCGRSYWFREEAALPSRKP